MCVFLSTPPPNPIRSQPLPKGPFRAIEEENISEKLAILRLYTIDYKPSGEFLFSHFWPFLGPFLAQQIISLGTLVIFNLNCIEQLNNGWDWEPFLLTVFSRIRLCLFPC